MGRLRLAAAVLAASAYLSGCETLAYYAQAVRGQAGIYFATRDVEILIADPATSESLRERLRLADELRRFAVHELRLPAERSYRRYADIGRRYVVWNVVATKEFSLDPVESCFPVAGCVPYRGFFREEAAREHAERLRPQGHDVFVSGVPAYSTLGRLEDPLLSSFIDYPPVELARLLFHELAHQRLYRPGDAAFNESFAVTVEREGVRRWLRSTGREADLADFERSLAASARLTTELDSLRERLSLLYRRAIPAGEMRKLKEREFAEFRSAWNASRPPGGRQASIVDQATNNAFLAALSTYASELPRFEQLLAEAAGDIERFYAAAVREPLRVTPRAGASRAQSMKREPGRELDPGTEPGVSPFRHPPPE